MPPTVEVVRNEADMSKFGWSADDPGPMVEMPPKARAKAILENPRYTDRKMAIVLGWAAEGIAVPSPEESGC
jgi:hypothetical protein